MQPVRHDNRNVLYKNTDFNGKVKWHWDWIECGTATSYRLPLFWKLPPLALPRLLVSLLACFKSLKWCGFTHTVVSDWLEVVHHDLSSQNLKEGEATKMSIISWGINLTTQQIPWAYLLDLGVPRCLSYMWRDIFYSLLDWRLRPKRLGFWSRLAPSWSSRSASKQVLEILLRSMNHKLITNQVEENARIVKNQSCKEILGKLRFLDQSPRVLGKEPCNQWLLYVYFPFSKLLF